MRIERWLYVLPLRLRSLLRRRDVEQDLNDELRDHIEQQTAENVRRGMSEAAARTAALRAMGGLEYQKEQARDTRGTRWLEELSQDVRYAIRTLRRSPGFTTVAALTLALGIGANTALFTLLDAVLLRTLPVRDAGQLVIVQRMARAPDGVISPRSTPYPTFQRLRRDNTVMTHMAALAFAPNVGVRIGDQPELLSHEAVVVTGDFFSLLGVSAAAGRLIDATDDRGPDAPPVAVLSYDYWTARLGRDPGAVGRSIDVNGSPFTVVGVTPAGFFGVNVGTNPDMYLPMSSAPAVYRSANVLGPSNGFLSVIGRLRPGVSGRLAAEQLGPMYVRARIETSGGVADAQTLKQYDGTTIAVESGARGLAFLRTQFGTPLVVLMTMVALVLVVACGNMANLLIARSTARRREIGIRLSVGAGRLRIVRQLVTESLLLALLGGVLGLTVAQLATRLLIALLDAGEGRLVLDPHPDLRILTFTFVVSLLTGVVFGVAPAFRATRIDLAAIIREGGRGTTAANGQMRLGRGLVVAQVALSIVLLVGTGLFVRSLLALRGIDVGFSRGNVVIVELDPRRIGYRGARLTALYHDLLERAQSVPAVRSGALADVTPLSGSSSMNGITVEGYTPAAGERTSTFIVRATPEYFGTIGLPVRIGSVFATRFDGGSKRMVVNEAFVRQFLRNGAIGRRARLGGAADLPLDWEIVGVVKDSPLRELRETALPQAYVPFLADTNRGEGSLVLRTSGSPEAVIRSTREMLRAVDARLEVLGVTTLEAQVARTMVSEQLIATIATFFGMLALLLASIGLYGVVSQNVARRTNEIAVRMALGATRAAVGWQILRQALLTVTAGLVIGVPLSLMAGRGVASLLYGVTATDAATILIAVATLGAVAIAASYLPAHRASRIDPAGALRAD